MTVTERITLLHTVLFKHNGRLGPRALIWCLACCLSVLIAPAAMAQDRGLAIEYTVKVADIPGQLFHVTTDIRNINQPALELSLPGTSRVPTFHPTRRFSATPVNRSNEPLESFPIWV